MLEAVLTFMPVAVWWMSHFMSKLFVQPDPRFNGSPEVVSAIEAD